MRRHKGTSVLKVNPDRPKAADVRYAAAILKNGGIITLPTDTVYGLAVDPYNPAAVQRLYRLKGRDDLNPVACLLADVKQAKKLTMDHSPEFKKWGRRHWPGALTLIARRKMSALALLSRGRPGLGLRVPANAWARALALAMGGAVAASSANISGQAPALDGLQAGLMFGGRVELLIDGGSCILGNASTVIDCLGPRPRILRQGSLEIHLGDKT